MKLLRAVVYLVRYTTPRNNNYVSKPFDFGDNPDNYPDAGVT